MAASFDNEMGLTNDSVFHFSEKTVRLGFVRKVYAILSAQLMLTSAVVAVFVAVPNVRDYVSSPEGAWVATLSMFGVLGFLFAMACLDNLRRTWPTNIICLLGFTVFESICLASVACRVEPGIVASAALITLLVTVGLTLYALQTKYDFTIFGGLLSTFLFAFLGFTLMALFMPFQIMHSALSGMGALLFGAYLVFDTQMMLGGKHKYSINPEEYIFAALNLYLDIINLFLYILSMLNKKN